MSIYQDLFKEAVEKVIGNIQEANRELIESGHVGASSEKLEAMISATRRAQEKLDEDQAEILVKKALENFVSDSILGVLEGIAIESLVKNLGGIILPVSPQDVTPPNAETDINSRFSAN